MCSCLQKRNRRKYTLLVALIRVLRMGGPLGYAHILLWRLTLESLQSGKLVEVRSRSHKANHISILSRLALGWTRLNEDTVGTDTYWWIALQNAAFYSDMRPIIEKYVRGRTLDIGAGRLAWRELLKKHSTSYLSADLTREHPDLDLTFDATGSYPFEDESFDTIYCCSVLEHAREPWRAFSEMWRVLAPGGVAIVSVPFVFYLHGQPHDYYRFSRYALTYLAERSGFEVVDIVSNGGLVQLLLNIPSVALSTLMASVGLTRIVPVVTRGFLIVDRILGRKVERDGAFAMNNLAIFRKPLGPIEEQM